MQLENRPALKETSLPRQTGRRTSEDEDLQDSDSYGRFLSNCLVPLLEQIALHS